MLPAQHPRLWYTVAYGIVALCLVSAAGIPKAGQTDAQKNHLQGHVKSIEDITCTIEGYEATGIKPGGETGRTITLYNTNGNIIKVEYYSYIMRKGRCYADSDMCRYNAAGQKVYGKHIRDGVVNWIDSFSYDRMGNNTVEVRYNKDGSLSSTISKKYDDSARVTEQVFKYPKETKFAAANRSVYEYDEVKQTQHWKNFRGDSFFHGGITRFDNSGNVAEDDAIDSTGQIIQKWVGTCDKYGNQLTAICTNPAGKVMYNQKWVYDYDPTGNWIKQTYYSFGQKTNVTERGVTYY